MIDNINLLKRQYLIHSLHTISAYFNASYNIINSNCLVRVYKIFDDFNIDSTQLRSLIENDTDIFIGIKINQELISGLDPLSNRDNCDEEQILLLEDREEKIRYAIWKILPTFPNPIYQELKHSCKELKTLNRLFYLQMVYKLQKSKHNNYQAYSPIGFCENMQEIETNQSKNDILCIGTVWCKESLDESIQNNIPMSLKVEKYFFENIITKVSNDELGWQQKSYLAIQLNSYATKSQDEIDLMLVKSISACKEIYHLQANYHNIIEQLEAFEWVCIVDVILFTVSDEFKYYINSFLTTKSDRLQVYVPLAKRTNRNFCIKVDITRNESIYSLEEKADSFNSGINIRRRIFTLFYRYKEQDKNFEKDLNIIYKKHLNYIFLAQKNKNKTFLHKLRYDMQNLKFDEVKDRLKDITRKANQLVFAHKISYYAYQGHEDRLYPLVHKRDICLRDKNRKQEKEHKKTAYENSTNTLREWGKDKNLRRKSKLYKSLDNEQIISRFLMNKDELIIQDSQKVVGEEIKGGWFTHEKDVLILPVMFHGRKQGILYLATNHKNQFLYQDRLNLTNFIQVFEAELFEARFTTFQKKMNIELRKAIKDDKDYKTTQSIFFNYISKKLSDLLGAVGTMIWWNHTDNDSNVDMIGVSGTDIDNIFPKNKIKKTTLFELINANQKDITYVKHDSSDTEYKKALLSLGYGHSINLIMKDEDDNFLGTVMILDKNKPKNISQAFEDEVKFLLGEIQESITHYFTVKGKIEIITSLLAHDVNSTFRTISSTKERLEGYIKSIPTKDKKDYNKKLIDIDVAVSSGKEMLDYITNDKIISESTEKTPILAYLNYLNDTKNIEKKVNIKDIIDNVLHGKKTNLKKNHIYFIFRPKNDLFDLFLWIHQNFLHDVLSNLVDNVEKYSKPSSRLYIHMIENPADYVIRVENIGIILNEEAKENPNIIFEKNIRCIPENKESQYKGKGIGLYISMHTCRFWGGNLTLEYSQIESIWANYKFEITFPKWLSSNDNPYKRR